MPLDEKYERMSKVELLAEVRRLHKVMADSHAVQEAMEDLRVHQEEIEVQNRQLVEMQAAVEESRDRYADLYDFAPVGYVSLDDQGVIKEINLTGAQLLGLERGRILGSNFLHYLAAGSKGAFLEHLRRSRKSEEDVVTELKIQSRGSQKAAAGKPQDISVQIRSTRAARTGMPDVYRTVIFDLTERMRGEEERRELQIRERTAAASSAAKDRFLAALSHELRTPLTPVLAILGNLDREGDLPEAVRGDVAVMRRNIAMEARLIDDLLDLTRITQGKLLLTPGTFDLHEVVRHAAASIKEELRPRRLHFSMDLRATQAFVFADASRLHQVITNLLKNAIKFTRDGGRITLISHNEGPPDAARIVVSVRDTGIGIEPSVLPTIFNAFEQGRPPAETPNQGLGLGLSICKGLMETQGGRIWATSGGTGQGSTFNLELSVAAPAIEPQPAEEPGPETAEKASAKKANILLVEDHSDTGMILSRLLRAEGHTVMLAGSVASARSQVDQGGVDIVVSDLGLPDGSGHDLMRVLKLVHPLLVGIALSGFGSQEDLRKSREAGFSEHLTKPVEIDNLLRAIDRVVRRVNA